LALAFFSQSLMDILKSKEQKGNDDEKPRRGRTNQIVIASYGLLALGSLAVYFLVSRGFLDVFGNYRNFLEKLTLCGFFAFVILIIARIIERIVRHSAKMPFARYNLIKAIRLLAVLAILMVAVTLVFENWYTAAVSLGLISLLLGFALQTPISSLIAWLYIVIRTPYNVGDRIQIESFKGDVVEINYLDTTLWEFGGDYLTNDLPSGRLIRFPNSLVLQYAIFNYSWKKFPYIWNEIPFHIAYESDLDYVEKVLREVTRQVLGPDVAERIRELKHLIEKTPVDELEIREYPYVLFKTHMNTWIEANVTYLVEPKRAASLRTAIIKKAVAQLLREPDRVMFPKSNAR
jgi:small-conductance mechanosensitive channel